MRKAQVVFSYFHLAAAEPLTRAVITYCHFPASGRLARAVSKSVMVAIAYETVQLGWGGLPLLTLMSEVARRMAVQEGAQSLEKAYGGRGILLGGVHGVPPAEVM